MSRSYRKTPIISHASDSEKEDKRHNNRRLRRKSKVLVNKQAEIFPIMREVSNVWNMAKDGKGYFGDMKYDIDSDSRLFYKKLMRK